MYDVFTQMTALIACGIGWRIIKPFGLDADQCRQPLTTLVYTLLLPALVIQVLWQAPLGLDSLRVSAAAAAGVLGAMALAWLVFRMIGTKSAVTGTLILAAAFPNATYMGLPVLEQLFGDWAQSIALQFDLFACTPILLTVGILVAQHYGNHQNKENPFIGLLKVPPLWAAVVGVLLNVSGITKPQWMNEWLGMLSSPVIPLMLIALGMSLQWSSWRPHYLPLLVPTLAIQLAVMPLIVWGVAHSSGLEGEVLTAVILEGAMPSMVLGLVLCDRYGLKTGLYAIAVTLSTLISLISIPLWYGLLGQ